MVKGEAVQTSARVVGGNAVRWAGQGAQAGNREQVIGSWESD